MPTQFGGIIGFFRMKNDTDISASPSEELRGIAVIIPSLNPCEHLTETVRQMHAAGFDSIILIDDGSTEETKKYFAEARELDRRDLAHARGQSR